MGSMTQFPDSREGQRALASVGIVLSAGVIFAIDAATPIEVSVSVLYVFVVLIASIAFSSTGVLLTGIGCEALTILTHLISPGDPWAHWPLLDRAIGVTGIAMSTLLVMRNRRAMEALDVSRAYLAQAQHLSHTGSVGWQDPEGVQFWSEETFRIYRYEPDVEPTLARMIARTHPDDRALLKQTIDRSFRDKTGFQIEHRLSMPDATTRYVQLVVRSADSRDTGTGFIGAVMDVTAARNAADELQAIQSDLARVTRATTMGQLAASIAHEVRQPLTGVITNGHTVLHWLNAGTLNIDKARTTAERMLRDGERANGVIQRIQGLLTKTPPQARSIDVNELIHQVLDLLQTELRLREVSVRTELAPSPPPVLGDAVQLQQVLLNLVINGADAMSDVNGRPRLLVVGSNAGPDGDGLIFVRDSGVGLDEGTIDKIFSPFFTTKPKGMGMGLAICRSIIEAHGGRLWASPAEPHGALFQFTLPGKARDEP
ncbi:PAS domain-containing sensor histidine kinase [Bradyrhizobium sp. BR 10289]|uniref:sensor histidine kinase n=1 Tax=Bradyrhizobium sp. BR 10289 TaxID=2749993 RepID=UPI001C648656|nr:PAS domain-containing sensor histidine kinase [Bradyrhizobium sp. BR 10289]MBW7974087.1 PAS domain-containing protein [Bradyrhizobium sp. BR 10289]